MSKILGIGNAITDIVIPVDSYDIIDELNLPHGGMVMIDEVQYNMITDKTKHLKKSYVAGGSSANTIYGLSKLGVETYFLGVIGNDEVGKIYENDLKSDGTHSNLIISDKTNTGCAFVFVTPDSERTFATYLGAASELTASHLQEEYFDGMDMLHIEGYLLFNYSLVREAMKMAKNKGLKISLDLAAHNFVEENRPEIQSLITDYVDICFANEEESKALTGLSPNEALDKIAEDCDFSIVKLGPKGAMVKHKNHVEMIDTIGNKCVDTTGAGDLFASGFIYGVVNNMTPKMCGQIGAILGGTVILNYGARIPQTDWINIEKMIHKKK